VQTLLVHHSHDVVVQRHDRHRQSNTNVWPAPSASDFCKSI
jgi:hypothetical protein